MKQQNVLIIFVKNPIYGKVKTRLAATIGKDKALEIYKQLIAHTCSVTKELSCDKIVYYSDHLQKEDEWSNAYFKAQQQGVDLGERMMNAFSNVFQQGYSKAVIIGTDCPAIDAEIINNAFEQLDLNDVVIGPATDGGYYLLGSKELHPQLFQNISWSTENVLQQTIAVCERNGLVHNQLQALSDIDEEKDLPHLKHLQP